MMRFETFNASQFLVSRLMHTQAVTNVRDEGDIILLDMFDKTQLMILIIERGMNLADLRYHYKTNTQRGIYTLMLLWVDMFIPRDGSTTELVDWMQVLDQLHGGKLYGYEVAGRDAFFFPVHLRGTGLRRKIHFGEVVNYASIGGTKRSTRNPWLPGEWLVGGFGFTQAAGYRRTPSRSEVSALSPYYQILGMPEHADLDAIKRAYRALARLYHPDVNSDSGADERMKRINEAYQQIVASRGAAD